MTPELELEDELLEDDDVLLELLDDVLLLEDELLELLVEEELPDGAPLPPHPTSAIAVMNNAGIRK